MSGTGMGGLPKTFGSVGAYPVRMANALTADGTYGQTSLGGAVGSHALQVFSTAGTAGTVTLQGSLDNVHWVDMVVFDLAVDNDGDIKYASGVVAFIRAVVSGFTGTDFTAYWTGVDAGSSSTSGGGGGGSGGLTDTELRASPVNVTGPLTNTQLRATEVPVHVGSGSLGVTGTVATTGPLTDTELRASAVPVYLGTQSVGITGSPAVTTGGLTDAQLRASQVPVYLGTQSVGITGTPTVTGPLTDTQLRASAVPVYLGTQSVGVTGTVATGGLTDTQLRASQVPVYLGTQSVGVTGVTPGTAATSLGKAEDAVAADGDTGVLALAVRRDTASSGVTTDGDYAALSVNSTGALRVAIAGQAGTTATDLAKAEDAAHVSGDTGIFVMGVRNDLALTSFVNANGDYSPFALDGGGKLFVTVGGGGNDLGKNEDGAHTSTDMGVMVLARRKDTEAVSAGTDLDYATFDVDSLGRQRVVSAPNPVTATLANVSSSASSVTLIAANAARRGWIIANDSTQILYVKFGTTASATSYTYMIPAATATQVFVLEAAYGTSYQGDITGIWASANGSARTTELVAA